MSTHIEVTNELIRQLQRAAMGEAVEINGETLYTRELFRIPEKFWTCPDPVKLNTLSGFVDFCQDTKRGAIPDIIETVRADRSDSEISEGMQDIKELQSSILSEKVGNVVDMITGGPAFVHVVDHESVRLVSDLFGTTNQRAVFAECNFKELLGSSFSFGKYYDKESFVVALQSLFVPTHPRADVLKVIGTIKQNQVREFKDDGVTQSVAASAGAVRVQEVEVPNPVPLRPWRTFREVDQPDSPFVLRVRMGDPMPECALFEADGGAWKLDAIKNIAQYLKDNEVGYPIMA